MKYLDNFQSLKDYFDTVSLLQTQIEKVIEFFDFRSLMQHSSSELKTHHIFIYFKSSKHTDSAALHARWVLRCLKIAKYLQINDKNPNS